MSFGSGFPFGDPSRQQQQQQQQLQPTFGAATSTPQQGFSFGSPIGTGTQNLGPFGASATTTQGQSPGFTFGASNTTAGSLFGGSTTGSSTGFGLGGTTGNTNLFGGVSNAPSSTATGFGFGAPNMTASNTGSTAGFGIKQPTTSTSFNFGGTPAAAATTSLFGSPATGVATSTSSSATSGFGSGSLFGAANTTSSPFGAAVASTAPITSTSVPAFSAFSFSTQPIQSAQTTAQAIPTSTLPALGSTPNIFQSTAGTQLGTTSTFSFGSPVTTASATVGAAALPSFGSTLGSQSSGSQVGTTSSLPFGSSPLSSTGKTALSAFGTPSVVQTTTSSQLGALPTSLPSSGITFGTPSTLQASAAPISTTVAATTVPSGLAFGLGTSTFPTATTVASTTSAPSTLSDANINLASLDFSFIGSKTPNTGLKLGNSSKMPAITAPLAPAITAAATTHSSLAPPLPSAVGATTQASLTTAVTTTSTVTPTVIAGVAPKATISFRKLEEEINKWTAELEEQERLFLTQATQVNAWDRVLINNGEKITHLNGALERVKLDQEHLDQEVDFIQAQQRELEELLEPLEKSVKSLPNLSIHQHSDLEREQTFQMAENIDAQLRHMSQDLKEIIEHINTTSGNQDANDPIYQIGKILNAHMDSLQWIDQNTAQLQKKIEEVSRLYDSRKQDHERGMQIPF